MFGDEFVHLKHIDDRFATEDFLESIVGVDIALVSAILKSLGLDISPQLLDDL